MKLVFRAVAASFFVAVAIVLLSWTTYFAQFNSTAYDFTLRLAGPVSPVSPTLIVAVDESSLDRVGAWPWSRDKLARLIERIETGHPRVIAVDVLLDERKSENEDNALARSISGASAIVLATRIASVNGVDRWRRPNERFVQKHVRLGHVHADPDFDGISRRFLSAKISEGRAVRAFAREALRAAGLPENGAFEENAGSADIIRPQAVNIRFVGDNGSFRHVPAWKVLEGVVQPAEFKNQIVLVGSTAEGIDLDQWFTPFAVSGQKMSGIEIHANAIETLYTGRAIVEMPDLLVLLGLWGLVLLFWWVDRRFEGRRFYATALLSIPVSAALSWLLMKYDNVWLPFPPFLAAIVVVLPGLEVAKLVRLNRDLDGKIQRLTVAALYERRRSGSHPSPAQLETRRRILAEIPAGPDRDGWLTALDRYERESSAHDNNRQQLFGTHRHNSRWKLDAVDFFNEELMQFLSFNNAILASIEDVIIVSNAAGLVVYQNPAAKRLEGYSPEPPFAPDYFASLLDGRTFGPLFARVLSQMEPLTREFVPARNGRSFYNVTLSPIARAGVVLSMHDATAQHELNQAKSDMVSLVSHELRTPLTSIRGYSDMLLKYNLVQEKGKEFLTTIIDESGRLNQLIQSFLNIAYIESGRQKITKSKFEIAPVFKDMVSVLGPVAAEKQIAIDAPADVDTTHVLADRLLLYQALTNLLTNAIKYSPPGTTVRIGVANGDGRIRFQISDQGCGIPVDEASKIFEKFYRRANKETLQQSGFGLGLAFVKEVAIQHGGDVLVESKVGEGSVFTLWIPN